MIAPKRFVLKKSLNFIGRRSRCLTAVCVACCLLVALTTNSCSIGNRFSEKFRQNDDLPSVAEDEEQIPCREYGVVLIAVTGADARQASYLLKTLMYHRRSPIHLHLLVTELTHQIMKTLLDTWELSHVRYDFYRITTPPDSKTLLLETMKFRLLEFLPSTVEQETVYLANELRLFDDLSVLWKQVLVAEGSAAADNRCLGLVKDRFCDRGQNGCHGDSIVMFDLKTCRNSALRSSLSSTKSLAEVEAALTQYRQNDGIFTVPCQWAVPLSGTESYRFNCSLSESLPVRGLVQLDNKMARFSDDLILERTKEHLATVLGSEPVVGKTLGCVAGPGTSSRDRVAVNQSITGTPTDAEAQKCNRFRHATHLKRRTHLYYLGESPNAPSDAKASEGGDQYEVTLVTQLTLDRLGVLERLVSNWAGPASVVFHVSDLEAMDLDRRIQESNVLRRRKSIVYHVVYKRQIYNPINYLRNVAINNSHTPYLLFVDVDLVPNPELYSSIRALIKKHMVDAKKKTVLVVPAFQMFTDLRESTPRNKPQLLRLMPNKTVVGYGMERSWNLGHKPTNYSHWVSATEPYQAIFSDAYEPYVVVRREFEARYNEDLLERMGDKIAYVRLLHGLGYEFLVMPNDFLIHVPHPISEGSQRFKSEPNYFHCSSRFFEAYRTELYRRFPSRKF